MRRLFTSIACFAFALSPLYADVNSEEDELKQEVCNILPSLHGWCSQEKAIHFIDLILKVRPKVCVEIGVFAGASIYPVASALKLLNHGVVIAIDPWSPTESLKNLDPHLDQHHIHWWKNIDYNQVYSSYLSLLKMFSLEDVCITIRAPAERAVKVIGTIDILHIDGNHSETSFTNAVKLYLPKVRSGGYIWLNDCLWTEAQTAMDLLLEECEVVKQIDNANCMLFKKR